MKRKIFDHYDFKIMSCKVSYEKSYLGDQLDTNSGIFFTFLGSCIFKDAITLKYCLNTVQKEKCIVEMATKNLISNELC